MKFKSNLIQFWLSIFTSGVVIIACSSGSSGSNNNPNTYAQQAIPLTTYPPGIAESKFAVYTSAGGGKSTLTEIDTGSDFYVIESSYVGTNIIKTTESLTLYYDHGEVQRSGYVAYGSVSFLSESGQSLLVSNNQVPIIVVPDGVISNEANNNHAIMGLRMNSNDSVKLYLPSPYNQMFIFNAPARQLIFGNFSPTQLESYGTVQLPQITCADFKVSASVQVTCWNDMAIPVAYTATESGSWIESTLKTLFDSGATSSFQYKPLPSWLRVTASVVTNPLAVSVATGKGQIGLELSPVVNGFVNDYNGGIVNAGNNLFNYNQVLFDQQHGQVGLQKVADPATLSVPLAYRLQGQDMGLHMPLQIGNNSIVAGVDTGSVGLRVVESALTDLSGIVVSNVVESYAYQDGVEISGVVAKAPVSIGGVSESINFMLITQISCSSKNPNCPKDSFAANGRAGLIGICLNAGGSINGVWSPLPQLPGHLGNGFYLNGNTNTPGLVVGLNSQNSTGFDLVNLNSISGSDKNPAQYPLWDVNLAATIHYPLKNGNMASASGSVLYDTGTAQYTVYNLDLSEQGAVDVNKDISQRQTLNNAKKIDWAFKVGTTLFVNAAYRSAESFVLVANTGNIPFTLYDILYNVESGKMGFRAH